MKFSYQEISSRLVQLTVLQNKTVYITNCRFFSATNYKYTDDDNLLDSDSNSVVSVVSDNTVDSNTSNPKNKLEETKKRLEHYNKEGVETRKDNILTNQWMKDFLAKKSPQLSLEQKQEYNSFIENETKEISEVYNSLSTKSLGNEAEKRKYAELFSQITQRRTNLSKWCADYLSSALGHTFTDGEKGFLENTLEAQRNLSRDLLTIRGNVDKLATRENNLKKVIEKQEQVGFTQGDDTNIGESSRGVKRNREGSLDEQNITKRQEIASSNQTKPSLLDDFADTSVEMPDYFGGDD